MARILIATVPLTGHFNPGVPLARELVRRGHEVRWYTGRKFRSTIEALGARFAPMNAGHDYDDSDVDRAFPGRGDLDGLARMKFGMKHIFIDAAPGCIADLEAILRNFPADVMVCDMACIGVPLLSERNGLPYATFSTSVLTISSHDTAPFGLALLPYGGALGSLRNRALNWAAEKFLLRDVDAHYQATRRRLGLSLGGGKRVFESSISPYLYLQTTVPSFEYPRADLPRQVHFVGPFLPEPTADFVRPTWWAELSEGRPVVHITQGTLEIDTDHLIVPALAGLAQEDVLVVASTGGKHVMNLKIDSLPSNARIETFVPHVHLLPHVRVMVTNAGYGGVQMALAHGIPLVAAGGTEDKPEVANRIAWSGAGINLRTKRPSPAQVREAVRTVLRESRYRAHAHRLRAEIARSAGPVHAAALLEQLARTRQPVLAPARARTCATGAQVAP